MTLITNSMPVAELKRMAAAGFGDMVKAVVDVERQVLAVDAELHADLEARLLQEGSRQSDLWGINLYPDASGDDWVEFDSMINLRPSHGNHSRGVDDGGLRAKILTIVGKLVTR